MRGFGLGLGRLWQDLRLRRRRPGPTPSWGVAMLAREPAALVLLNIAWHLEAGAQEFHLYLDDPQDPVFAAAAAIPGVFVTRCGPEFWARAGRGRPVWNNRRQSAAVDQAYRNAGVDWLLHLDADEFLWQRRPLAAELAGLSPRADALVLPVRERAYASPDPQDLFEGIFRIPQEGLRRRHPLLRPNAAFCPAGVSGHTLGKSLTRRGLEVSIWPHYPHPLAGQPIRKLVSRSSTILHFDGLTPRNWLFKFLRYQRVLDIDPKKSLGSHRKAQIAEIVARRGDPERMLAFHDRIKLCADPAAWLRAGLAEAIPFDPRPAALARLGHVPDLSVAAFDAETRRDEPELMRGL